MSHDEVVALYDPDDVCGRVVGAAPRSRVRAENLPHAATGVLLRRSTGEVFVHRRAATKDLWPSALDAAAGGVVLAGETVAQAARRELAEEVGVEGVELVELLTAWYADDDTRYLAHVHEAVWDGDVRFRDEEVAEGWWESPERLAARLADPAERFVPDTRHLLGLLVGGGGWRLGPASPGIPATGPSSGAASPGAADSGGARFLTDAGTPDPVDGWWRPGDTVVHRYGRDGRTRFARLGRVLQHDEDGLVLWVGRGHPAVEQAMADGRAVRDAPLPERFTGPRMRRATTWRGPGIVVLVPPGGRAWSLWWFFDEDGRFTGWYGNLEAPSVLRTTARGSRLVDSADRALDVRISPDRVPSWKDEDEFDALTALGTRWPAEAAPGIRADGEELMALARAGDAPFDGRWTDFSPDPSWPLPTFPDDWDVPHLAGP